MKRCGYIDILGSRAAAERDPLELQENMSEFQSCLSDNFSHFDTGKIFSFGDGAFFVFSQTSGFIDFYRLVRNRLLSRNLYFKCSVVDGEIEFSMDMFSPPNYSGPKENFLCVHFMGNAANAYQQETLLKGIGCNIKCTIDSEEQDNFIPNSFFIRRDGRGKITPIPYRDVSFQQVEISNPRDENYPNLKDSSYDGRLQSILDDSLYGCHDAIIQNDYDSEKYTSLFATMIRSSDFSTLKIEKGKWIDYPYIFQKLVLTSGNSQSISRLPGLKFLMLSIFDEYFTSVNGDVDTETVRFLSRKISEKKEFIRNLSSVPEFIISSNAKRALVDGLARNSGIKES
jgi:hypothetical protein